ncbi:HFX_2341 family transcriptional regulator domain-containing protein [Natronorubrum sp. DTA7]|uniref:HFX_2341 family transcriptional regulator domain-containing protein n=1 Tax=Natronorubrum sp. DTA7 TaxID=3447016 RepID=UPI003F82A11E
MNVVKRVHVVPLGYEYDRIVEPIRAQRADLVYLLADDRTDNSGDSVDSDRPNVESTGTNSTDGDAAVTADYHDDLRAELESAVPDVETRRCDLGDVYAVLGEVTTIAAEHAEDTVSVNVSGAGTIPAIGATMACMDVSTDAHAYYVQPSDYAHEGEREPISTGVAETERLPTYPIDSPTPDQVAIMGFLADPDAWDGYHEARTSPPKKKDLIGYARDRNLSFMADRRPPAERGGEDKGAFRVLDTHVLDPLEADGYVTIESVGRRRVVELTEQGTNAYRAFKHKLADD